MRTKELFQSWYLSKYFWRRFSRSVTQKVKFILKQPVRNNLEKTTRKEILEICNKSRSNRLNQLLMNLSPKYIAYIQSGPSMMSWVDPHPFNQVDPHPFNWVDPHPFDLRVWIDSGHHWRSGLYIVPSKDKGGLRPLVESNRLEMGCSNLNVQSGPSMMSWVNPHP